jgi:hypothetical protein
MFAMQFTSSCASRGFKLSQQMPGMDNKLNPVFAQNGALQSNRYIVNGDGSIALKNNDSLNNELSNNKRQVASSEKSDYSIRINGLLYESPTSPVVNSTLDPQNGAVLLGN